MLAMFFCWPDRNPSPSPTSKSKDPTPQAMPNMVRKERSLCAHNVRITWPKISNAILITVSQYVPKASPVPLLDSEKEGLVILPGFCLSNLPNYRSTAGLDFQITRSPDHQITAIPHPPPPPPPPLPPTPPLFPALAPPGYATPPPSPPTR